MVSPPPSLTSRPLISPEQVLRAFDDWPVEQERRDYLHYHYRRYAVLVAWVAEAIAELDLDRTVRLLDIGSSYQTALFRDRLPGVVVDTLGIEDTTFPPRDGERHIPFDLNDAQDGALWPTVDQAYDVIVMAEVLEHVHTAPELVLGSLRPLLALSGRFILQTPNGVALRHRVRMLCGYNPYELIRRTPWNPGHFREYTMSELRAIALDAGYAITRWHAQNYFTMESWKYDAYNFACRVLPPSLRDGLTLVLTPHSEATPIIPPS
jgi:SAM-dependent methyltransferase